MSNFTNQQPPKTVFSQKPFDVIVTKYPKQGIEWGKQVWAILPKPHIEGQFNIYNDHDYQMTNIALAIIFQEWASGKSLKKAYSHLLSIDMTWDTTTIKNLKTGDMNSIEDIHLSIPKKKLSKQIWSLIYPLKKVKNSFK